MSYTILVVEDDAGLREAIVDTLSLTDYQVLEADSGEAALVMMKKQPVDLVLTDVQMGGMDGLMLLRSIKGQWPDLPVVLMTAFGSIHDAVDAMKDGACDYLAKPFSPQSMLAVIERYLKPVFVALNTPVVGDAKSHQLLALAKRVALSDATVMVMGPSGSGKEVIARYIHQQSARADAPFVAINCAAIPENMLEATLFGYEKGAFTGAVSATAGKFEQAQNGTLLLDEITEMDLALQSKLLRVLQEREVERLGGRKTITLNVRVLATSNRDLKQAVADGTFREDLYYRLNVFPLTWLPLAERSGDIIPLAQHLIAKHWAHHPFAQQLAQPQLTTDAEDKLLRYRWPGNVRELENVVQRALILMVPTSGQNVSPIIETEHIMIDGAEQNTEQQDCYTDQHDRSVTSTVIPSREQSRDMQANGAIPSECDPQVNEVRLPEKVTTAESLPENLTSGLMQQEHKMILDTLKACAGSRKDVAERLGISPRTLRYKLAKMREVGIQIPA